MARWIACFWLFLLTTSVASACSVDPTVTDEQRLDRAKSVFIAHVIRTEEVDRPYSGADMPQLLPESRVIRATFRTIEVFKGQPPADAMIRSLVFAAGNCTLPIVAGVDYLIFLPDSSFVDFSSGSRGLPPLENPQDEKTKRVLTMLRNFRDKQ